MNVSDEYNKLDLRTRKIARFTSNEARVLDLERHKERIKANCLRDVREINGLINNLMRFIKKDAEYINKEQ